MKKDIRDIFDNSNTLIYLAMSIMNRDTKNIVPELLYTVSREDLLKLITVFGGEKIYIPQPSELKFYMNCAIAAYYYKCQNKKWSWIQVTMELTTIEMNKVKEKVKAWIKACPKDELKILETVNTKGKLK